MKFVDLFCGVGGFHHALADLGHECVFACDIDKDCRDVYHDNWDMTVFNDVREWVDEIDAHDILCAGFPCQPFSKSGKQEGFNDKIRGTLFGEIIKIVSINQPKFILLENVANLRTHDGGRTMKTIRSVLQEKGYHVKDKIMSPDQFGIPHHRPRIFIVAIHKEKIPNFSKFRFPRPHKKRKDSCHVDDLHDKDSIGQIPLNLADALHLWNIFLDKLPKRAKPPSPTWSMEFGRTYDLQNIHPVNELTKSQLFEILSNEGIQANRSWTKSRMLLEFPPYIRKMKTKLPEWKIKFITKNREFWNKHGQIIGNEWLSAIRCMSETHQKFEWHVGKSKSRDIFDYMIHSRPSGIRISNMNRIPSLVAIAQIPIIGPWGRKISPREAANAQSFKPDFVLHKDKSTAYKQLGNSVNVRVVTEIVIRIMKLEQHNRNENLLLEQ